MIKDKYDYVIIGSGFGGSVSALRLSEKGYSVLVIEKGRWKNSTDFPKTNWNLRKWLWLPLLGFYGIFKMTFFRHLSVISGVGVGGGSLVYANTLPMPKKTFYESGSWKDLTDWQGELEPYYTIAYKMLGAEINPKFHDADNVLKKLTENSPVYKDFEPTKVAIYFGEPDEKVSDPYFDGTGPDRTGCNYCGQCMTGCPHDSKNTLDKNYLFFAQKNGAKILAENYVTNVRQCKNTEYEIQYRRTRRYFSRAKTIKCKGLVFAGGVLGTVPLLLKLKASTLPQLSDMVGKDVRSNNEALIFVTTPNKSIDMSKGVAIGSILNTSEHSHLEPVRYGSGSGFWRIGVLPMVSEAKLAKRLIKLLLKLVKNPITWLKIYSVRNFAKQTIVLLYMEDLEGTLQIKNGILAPKTSLQNGEPPSAFLPHAHELANQYSALVKGKPLSFVLETLAGTPSTAHILGGSVIGEDANNGVIDKFQKVFNYDNMYVCDGSAISANPGVNPALTITAMTERAMSYIKAKP